MKAPARQRRRVVATRPTREDVVDFLKAQIRSGLHQHWFFGGNPGQNLPEKLTALEFAQARRIRGTYVDYVEITGALANSLRVISDRAHVHAHRNRAANPA